MSYADCRIEFSPTKLILYLRKFLGVKRHSIIHGK